jgi:hypothetical protein
MLIRSLLLTLAVGCAVDGAAPDHAGTNQDLATTSQDNLGGFQCANKLDIQVVQCVGSIAVLPINVNVKDVGVLNDNQLNVLSDDLNDLSIKDISVLDNAKILDDVEVTVLQDFLDKFLVNVSKNSIDVCTALLGIQLCK